MSTTTKVRVQNNNFICEAQPTTNEDLLAQVTDRWFLYDTEDTTLVRNTDKRFFFIYGKGKFSVPRIFFTKESNVIEIPFDSEQKDSDRFRIKNNQEINMIDQDLLLQLPLELYDRKIEFIIKKLLSLFPNLSADEICKAIQIDEQYGNAGDWLYNEKDAHAKSINGHTSYAFGYDVFPKRDNPIGRLLKYTNDDFAVFHHEAIRYDFSHKDVHFF